MSRLLPLLLVLLGAYAVYCAVLYGQQRRVLFPGAGIHPTPVPRLPPGVRAISIETPTGSVEAWFRAPASMPGPVVIFAHGNAELIDDGADLVAGFSALGIGTLLVEYPGYGRSEGSPSLTSLEQAYDRAYDWLVAQPETDSAKIVAMGRSIGTGVAARLATRRAVAALILQSPFTRISDFATGLGVPPFLVRDRFDNLDAVARYDGPVLVLHGRFDDVVPFAHGAAVVRASPRASLVPLDCAHNDCPRDAAAWWRAISTHLDDAFSAGGGARTRPPRTERSDERGPT